MRYNKNTFVAKVLSRCIETDNGCFEWTGAKNSDGYGNIAIPQNLQDFFLLKWEKTHRVIYRAFHDKLEHSVLHKCDNPACCNIEHLFEGTQDDNMKDAARKGHMPSGANHKKAVLTQERVDYIRSFYKDGRSPYGMRKVLARELGVSYWTIDQVLRYTTWKHEK